MERRLQNLNWLTVRELVPSQIDTIILPVGTVEAHGSSCLGTDNVIPEAISDDIAESINALIAPCVNHGVTRSLQRYAGGTAVSPSTLKLYVGEILDSLAACKFHNVIIMNGHGGNNSALKDAAFEFHARNQANVCVVHWWQLCEQMTNEFFGHAGGHGGTDETAMVLAVDPSLVSQEQYSRDLAYQFKPGADVYPVPGTILLYKEGEGYPEFDVEQAERYRVEVSRYVSEFIQSVLDRWRKFDL
ncbi:MAG: creatininase family protein [candidate division Zixibacteria bacterium]